MTSSPAAAFVDRDCADFSSQAAAQKFFKYDQILEPDEVPCVMMGDLNDQLIASDFWTEQMLVDAGIPIIDVPFVTVGGGIGSFVTVDYLRAQGLDCVIADPRHVEYTGGRLVADGAPVDDSTLSVNSGTYLERHLRQVIGWIEARSPVELVAIGIGHDVTRYYSKAVTIMDAEQLGGTMVEQLAGLFDTQ